MKKRFITVALGLMLFGVNAVSPAGAQTIKDKRAAAYKSAKAVMPPDLYLIYRVADRIITTNDIKRPIRVAVRNNVDCAGILGIDPSSAKCQSVQMLPKVDKATNFDIWAAQVVGTMSGDANASL